MHVFELVQLAYAAEQVHVTVRYAEDLVPLHVFAEAKFEFLDLVSMVSTGFDLSKPEAELVRIIKSVVLNKVTTNGNVVFGSRRAAKGPGSSSNPFTGFLNACSFVEPFRFSVNDTEKPAYRTSNYQFVMIYENATTVGSLGKVTFVEFNTKRKISGLSLRKLRANLAEYAENVPNERGVTGAQKRTGNAPSAAKVAQLQETRVSIPNHIRKPVDLSGAQGKRFTSFEDLGSCLLSALLVLAPAVLFTVQRLQFRC
jgi:hypothetical protein